MKSGNFSIRFSLTHDGICLLNLETCGHRWFPDMWFPGLALCPHVDSPVAIMRGSSESRNTQPSCEAIAHGNMWGNMWEEGYHVRLQRIEK